MTVVASDGADLAPVEVDRMIVAVSETYDVIVTIPASGSAEFKATPEDRTQFLLPYVGWDYRYRKADDGETTFFGQTNTKNRREVFCAGLRYTLPMFVVADVRIDQAGKFRIQLGREDVALTSRLRFNFMVNTDREYMAGFRYILTKYFALSTHYDSDMGIGAGVTLSY